MTELRGLAQHAEDLEQRKVRVVAISVDDEEHAHEVWDKVASRKFNVLSDPGAQVIRKYGILHAAGRKGQDIALRATVFIDPKGIEKWRRVSQSVPDIPTFDETLSQIRRAQDENHGMDRNH
jgi:peroxiredoxin